MREKKVRERGSYNNVVMEREEKQKRERYVSNSRGERKKINTIRPEKTKQNKKHEDLINPVLKSGIKWKFSPNLGLNRYLSLILNTHFKQFYTFEYKSVLNFFKYVLFSLPEFKNSRLLVLPLLLEIQIRNGSKSNRFCRKMEQMQSQVMEHFVTKIISSFSANVLASVLVEATAHRNLFAFSDFFSLSSLQQLKATENCVYLDMLQLFAYGTWSDYKNNAGRLPQLIPDQILKLKQLTVLTLASTYEVLPYDQLMQELDVTNVSELQDFLIDECMYSGLVRGKLDHLRQCLVVQFAACRDLCPANLGSMIQTLSNWLSESENLLVVLQEEIILADARHGIEKLQKQRVELNLQEVTNNLVKAGVDIPNQEGHWRQLKSLGNLQEAAYNVL
ncbi:COP9 signalosome complex subunit 7 isoform X2 [Vigna radiata var. radiata]|uniref:COP9 signalosome complex subunit 7 isoform X2 n=1 Tax=Vigna radiata var. radiata TaxID=3916 RepID=A0A1S3TUH4_VIGRR|nr:COP9 signalosome complex subunit 7 isoform X2 [Vigna radiata var. radiata]